MGHITQIGGSGDFVKLELVQAITIVDEKTLPFLSKKQWTSQIN